MLMLHGGILSATPRELAVIGALIVLLMSLSAYLVWTLVRWGVSRILRMLRRPR